MANKEYYYYYFDEKNDDFANNGIETKILTDSFEYYPKNVFYRFFKPVVYYAFMVIVTAIEALTFSPKKNRRVLRNRRERKKGYFIYGNHTTGFIDAISTPVIALPRACHTVVNPDAISIKGCGTFIRMLGAVPTPYTPKNYRDYLKEMDRLYDKGKVISIYPEAHIWPKYNEIRDFSSVSFALPVKYNAACFAKTVVYTRKKNGRTRATVYFDGPFYPDEALPRKKAADELCERIKAQMRKRAESSELDCRYHYIKVASPEEVRTEIK